MMVKEKSFAREANRKDKGGNHKSTTTGSISFACLLLSNAEDGIQDATQVLYHQATPSPRTPPLKLCFYT